MFSRKILCSDIVGDFLATLVLSSLGWALKKTQTNNYSCQTMPLEVKKILLIHTIDTTCALLNYFHNFWFTNGNGMVGFCFFFFFNAAYLSFNGTLHVLQESNEIWRPSRLFLQHSSYFSTVSQTYPRSLWKTLADFLMKHLKENHLGCLQK